MLQRIKNNTKNQKGFTLVELMVVIAIIGVLAAIAVPRFTTSADAARGAKVQADLRTLDSALMMYVAANSGTLPAEGTAANLVNAAAATNPLIVNGFITTMPVPPAGLIRVGANARGTAPATYGVNIGTLRYTITTITTAGAGLYTAETL